MKPFNYRQGFTLLECLITMAILATLASLAVPSFTASRDRAQQLYVIDQLEAVVVTARHIAVSERAAVTLCGLSTRRFLGESVSTDTIACGDSYARGVSLWIETTAGWHMRHVWEWGPVVISNRDGSRAVSEPIVFSPRGLAFRNMTWSTCVNGANLSLVLNRAGRPVRRMGWGHC